MRAMHNAVSMMVNQMEAMHTASGQMMDTSSVELARRDLAKTAEQFNRIENEIRNADNAQQRFTNNIRDGTSEADGLLNKIMGFVGAYLGIQTIGNVLVLSDELTNTTARLALINDGLQTTAELQEMIFYSAQRSRGAYADTASMVAKIGAVTGDLFSNNRELVQFVELANKSFATFGATTTDINSAMLQMTQALANGVVQWEELGAMMDTAPQIVQNLAKYLGISQGELKNLASESKITSEMLKNSMFWATQSINQSFEQMPMTWGQVWTSFKNEALKAFQPVLQEFNNLANSERFQGFVNGMVQALYVIATVTLNVFNVLSSIGSFIYDNWSFLGPIILGVGGALLVYASYLKIVTLGTLLVTAAQWAWNAALTANPIGLVIAAIVLLIGLFYGTIAAVNHFAGTSISATGIIAGAFMVLGAHIYNMIAFIWNGFAAFLEFLVNASTNRTYAARRLFYNMAANILDYAMAMTRGWDNFATNFVNAIISAVNKAIRVWNKFVDILPSDIAMKIGLAKGSEYGRITSVTSSYDSMKGVLKNWVGEAPADYWEAPKMEMKSLGAAWDKGYNWGDNLFNLNKNVDKSNRTDDMQKAIEDAMKSAMDAGGIGDKLDKANRNGGSTAGNTAKMAKSMEGAGEDLKYMRDLADREAINRYTTAEVKVNMKNENHINNEMDIDGVIDRFGEKVEEVAEMLAEGGPTDNV